MTFHAFRKVLIFLVFLILLSSACSAIAGITRRVSVSSIGEQGNSTSLAPCLSADGRYAAFDSASTNLVSGDINADNDVFVRDMLTGVTEMISVSSTGEQGNSGSYSPSISADGRYVSFVSDASNLVPNDTNDTRDIFVRDMLAGTTERVNVSSSGVQANFISYLASISADGRYVSFSSNASNLVAGDTNGSIDVFVRDITGRTTERVSVAVDGGQGDSDSDSPSLSADGRYVAFYSFSSNLIHEDANGVGDIFVKDRATGAIEIVSISASGGQGDSNSNYPSMSADGRYVAFYSTASNLVADDTNGAGDIFVRDRVAGTIKRVSVSFTGSQGNSDSYQPSISADGRYTAFYSNASNLVSGDINGVGDIFVKDLLTDTIERVSISTDGEPGNSNSYAPSISSDGKHVVFASNAPNLVTGDTNGQTDIFIRDRTDSPINTSLTPNSGSIIADQRTTLTSVYTDSAGYVNIRTCYLLLNTSFTTVNAGYFFYDTAKNRLYLRKPDDAAKIGGYAPGKGTVIDNGFIVLNCARTTVVRSGNTLTINWSISLKPSFAEKTCKAWMQVTNKTGGYSHNGKLDAWDEMGSFNVLINPAPKNEALIPPTGVITTNSRLSMTSIYSDPAGYANINNCYLMMNTNPSLSGTGYCFYDSIKNKLYLRKVDSPVMIGGFAPGSANVIDNGCIILNCADTNVSHNSNSILINWNISLKSYFAGSPCLISMQVTNKTGQADLWKLMDIVTVNP